MTSKQATSVVACNGGHLDPQFLMDVEREKKRTLAATASLSSTSDNTIITADENRNKVRFRSNNAQQTEDFFFFTKGDLTRRRRGEVSPCRSGGYYPSNRCVDHSLAPSAPALAATAAIGTPSIDRVQHSSGSLWIGLQCTQHGSLPSWGPSCMHPCPRRG